MPVKALRIVLSVAFVALMATFLCAQEAAPEAEKHGKTLFELFKATGTVGILLLVTSMIGTGLLIQFLLTINESKLGNPELLNEVEQLLSEGNLDEALTMAQADPSFAGKVLAGALGRSSGGYEEVRKGLEETAAVESFRVNARISLLSLVGNIGPLLGLLGTVTGMITSFQKIEMMKAPTPGDLAVGVYESLVNTTMGLFISIIFLSSYFFMKNKITDVMLRISTEISDMFARIMAPQEGASQ
jgi:biopolymer transport protein ExbB